MKRRGSNQYQIKWGFRAEQWASFWFIGFMVAVGIPLVQTKVVDMCPREGCGGMFKEVVFAKEYVNLSVKEMVLVEGMRMFGVKEVADLEELLNHESHFDPYATNPTSGACGIFQALPCSKMKCQSGDAACQVKWGMSYIKSRYGTPSNAWAFWKEHNWY